MSITCTPTFGRNVFRSNKSSKWGQHVLQNITTHVADYTGHNLEDNMYHHHHENLKSYNGSGVKQNLVIFMEISVSYAQKTGSKENAFLSDIIYLC